MRYPEYEELLADSRPNTAAYSTHSQLDLIGEDTDLKDLLRKSHQNERQRIEAELKDVDSQLHHRKEIHKESVAELEDAVREEKTRLQRLQRPFPPEDRIISQKQRIRHAEQQLQKLQRNHWQDCQQLQREQRRLQRELSELMDTEFSAFF
jgi:DNA repair ATPase RecN